jgi:hypothetical protein
MQGMPSREGLPSRFIRSAAASVTSTQLRAGRSCFHSLPHAALAPAAQDGCKAVKLLLWLRMAHLRQIPEMLEA